jgi:hypothetical protein
MRINPYHRLPRLPRFSSCDQCEAQLDRAHDSIFTVTVESEGSARLCEECYEQIEKVNN